MSGSSIFLCYTALIATLFLESLSSIAYDYCCNSIVLTEAIISPAGDVIASVGDVVVPTEGIIAPTKAEEIKFAFNNYDEIENRLFSNLISKRTLLALGFLIAICGDDGSSGSNGF